MLPAGIEPAIPASERPQTHALNNAAAGIGIAVFSFSKNVEIFRCIKISALAENMYYIYVVINWAH
jgi:hypothetical protein